MIDEKILEELNQQVQEETYSGYIYLAMAAWLEEEGYKGMANWMRVQAREEKIHADIFYNYILERGGHVNLQAIEAPPDKWKTPLELFKAALEHEEQVEEEANVGEAVQQLSIVGEEGRGILMVDREMSTRVFSVPASAPWYPKSGQPGSMAA